MTIEKKLEGTSLSVALAGRLDTVTAPDLDAELKPVLEGITELVFDFEQLEYVSSAGLRVLLHAQKVMNAQGTMKVTHVRPEILEIFEITGFNDILTIE